MILSAVSESYSFGCWWLDKSQAPRHPSIPFGRGGVRIPCSRRPVSRRNQGSDTGLKPVYTNRSIISFLFIFCFDWGAGNGIQCAFSNRLAKEEPNVSAPMRINLYQTRKFDPASTTANRPTRRGLHRHALDTARLRRAKGPKINSLATSLRRDQILDDDTSVPPKICRPLMLVMAPMLA